LTLKLGLQRLLDYTPALAALNKIESVRAAACAQETTLIVAVVESVDKNPMSSGKRSFNLYNASLVRISGNSQWKNVDLCLPQKHCRDPSSLSLLVLIWGAHPWLEVGRTSGDSGGLVGLSDGQVFGLLPLRSLVLWATLPLNEPNKPWTALTPALVSTPEEARVAACTGMRLVLQEVAPSQRHAEVLVASDCSVSFRALRLTPNPPPNQTRSSARWAEEEEEDDGDKWFHYLYTCSERGETRWRTELTKGWSCPFCFVRNGFRSSVGLAHHLLAHHDQFNFHIAPQNPHEITVTCRPDLHDAHGNYQLLDACWLGHPTHKEFVFAAARRYGGNAVTPEWSTARMRTSHHPEVASATDSGLAGAGQLGVGGSGDAGRDTPDASSEINPATSRRSPHRTRSNLGTPAQPHSRRPPPTPAKPPPLTGGAVPTPVASESSKSAASSVSTTGRAGRLSRTPSRSCNLNAESLSGLEVKNARGSTSVKRTGMQLPSAARKKESKEAVEEVASGTKPAQSGTAPTVFYHSRTCQIIPPAELENPVDSDDELDYSEFVASDQRALDEFVDVAREEKELMHLWNIFVVRNPIYSDAQLADSVKLFARANAPMFRELPSMRRCFVLHLINLHQLDLITPQHMDDALAVLDVVPE